VRRVVPLSVLLIVGLISWHFLRKPAAVRNTAPAARAEAPAGPAPLPPDQPEEVGLATAPPISGRVLDARKAPLSGIEVVCGSEAASSGADGGFRFAPRPGSAEELSIRRQGAEIARFSLVFVGGSAPSAGAEHGMTLEHPERQPVRIRWTVNLGYGESAAGAGAAQGSPAFPGFAEPVAVLVEDWATTGLVRILGKSRLPDGAHLDSALYFDGERLVSSVERAQVKGGRFESHIRFPEDLRIPSGSYQLRLTFVAGDEDPGDLERWATERPELPWNATEAAETSAEIYSGDPAEELAENRSLEQYYGEVLEAIDSLKRMILSRGREALTLAQGWDPELLRDRAASAEAWFGDPLLDASGKLDLKAWRKFLDEGLRPEIRRLLERHQARSSGKYRSAESMLGQVLERVLLLSKIESVLVYQALGLNPHPDDRFLDTEGPMGDELILRQVIEKEIKALSRMQNLTGNRTPSTPEKR